MNNAMVHHLAEQFAVRVYHEAGGDPAQQLERAYWIALSRPPSDEERHVGLDALTMLAAQWSKHPAAGEQPNRDAASRKALTTFCHAIVNSASFLYVD
jgi:hypothetical protein